MVNHIKWHLPTLSLSTVLLCAINQDLFFDLLFPLLLHILLLLLLFVHLLLIILTFNALVEEVGVSRSLESVQIATRHLFSTVVLRCNVFLVHFLSRIPHHQVGNSTLMARLRLLMLSLVEDAAVIVFVW